jgi:hypothetical protein
VVASTKGPPESQSAKPFFLLKPTHTSLVVVQVAPLDAVAVRVSLGQQ